MSRPWMPLYIADYRAKTTRLSAAQHGAYLLLIMDYWTNGGLPADDATLARIACMTLAEWKKNRPVIAEFFTADWRHTRIDDELAKSASISSKRREAAVQRHSKKDANAHATAPAKQDASKVQLDTHARGLSQSTSATAGDARASLTDHLPAAERIWQAIPIDPDDPTWFGQQHRVAQWLADWDLDLDILPTIARVMKNKPPGKIRNLKYFESAIADAHASRTAPLPAGTPQPNGGKPDETRGNVLPAADDIVAGIRAFSGAPSGRAGSLRLRSDQSPDAVRLLPDRGRE